MSDSAAKPSWTRSIFGEVRSVLSFTPDLGSKLVVAHLALESGFGTSRAALRGLNLGNITAGSWWTGGKWVDVGGDVDAEGKPITQTWRTYGSVAAFLADYWSFLGPCQNSGRYVLARNALERGYLESFSKLAYSAGYFELNPVEYSKRLHGALEAVVIHLDVPRLPSIPPVTPPAKET